MCWQFFTHSSLPLPISLSFSSTSISFLLLQMSRLFSGVYFPPTHSSSAAPLLQEAEGHCRGVGMDGTACFGDSPQIPLVIPVTATAMQRPSRLYTRSFAHFIHSLPLSLSLALSLLSSHFLFVSFEVVLETFLVPCKWTGVLKQKNLNHS